MFGALNTVFSGLAFAGIIVTIIMQMKELRISREQLIRSATAQDKTQKALNKQLTSLQSSSQIEAVEKYLQSLEEYEGEKKRIANEVIKRLTLNVFRLEQFRELTSPEFAVRTILSPIQYKFLIHNIGAQFEFETINNQDRLDIFFNEDGDHEIAIGNVIYWDSYFHILLDKSAKKKRYVIELHIISTVTRIRSGLAIIIDSTPEPATIDIVPMVFGQQNADNVITD